MYVKETEPVAGLRQTETFPFFIAANSEREVRSKLFMCEKKRVNAELPVAAEDEHCVNVLCLMHPEMGSCSQMALAFTPLLVPVYSSSLCPNNPLNEIYQEFVLHLKKRDPF